MADGVPNDAARDGRRPVRVAVVGSGLSGLAAAHLLSSQGGAFAVTLYEKAAEVGMDAASVDLKCFCAGCSGDPGSAEEHAVRRIDVPMRGIYPQWYTYVCALYDHIGVPYAPVGSGSSFSVRYASAEEAAGSNRGAGQAPVPPKSGQEAAAIAKPPLRPSKGDDSDAESTVAASDPSSDAETEPADAHDVADPAASPIVPVWASDTFRLLGVEVFLPSPSSLPSIYTLLDPRNYLWAARAGYSALRTLWQWYRVMRSARDLRAAGQLGKVEGTIGEWLAREGFDDAFVGTVFLQGMGSICTCTIDDVAAYPARDILDFFAPRTRATGWLRYPLFRPTDHNFHFVQCGIREVCSRLTAPVERVLVGTGIARLEFIGTPSDPRWLVEDDRGGREEYDAVIIATQAHQAARILRASPQRDPAAAAQLARLASLLGTVRYVRSLVAVHSDPSLLPPRPAWRSMNFVVHNRHSPAETPTRTSPGQVAVADPIVPTDAITGSHWLNHTFPHLGARPHFQTWNPHPLPRPELTSSLTWFDRALVTTSSSAAIDALDELQGQLGIGIAGSYAWPGIPLLEGCVRSAARCCAEIARSRGMEVRAGWLPGGWEAWADGRGLGERYFAGQA
ncbi:hypothetical protein DFJ74DRAFT_75671 [Hyaloraphidium curvatum]|nr:hypothetical protein DFJ74DRAFT_75671 [Hyaloraphidium curvatum]